MKVSRVGIILTTVIISMLAGSCSYYYKVVSRKALVDGAKAYNERNYEEAEELFRSAVYYDEELTTFEGRTAQLFLARTLHSEYAAKRKDNEKKAEAAIGEYQKALKGYRTFRTTAAETVKNSPENEDAKKQLESTEKELGSIVSAVASLYQNLNQDDKWLDWQTKQAADETMPPVSRAKAYISLAAKQYTCANDISDAEEVKKTVTEGDKQVFQFSKPENEEDFEKLQSCTKKGMELIDNALKLDDNSESAWSYKTSLLLQKSRIAEMEGENEERDKFKAESDKAKERYSAIAKKKREAEEKKAAEEAKKKAEAMEP